MSDVPRSSCGNSRHRDSDLSDLDEENDFYEPSDPEESSKEEMSDENVEDSPDKCEREESKMAASWWVYKVKSRIAKLPKRVILILQLLDAKNKPQENQDNDFSAMHKKV